QLSILFGFCGFFCIGSLVISQTLSVPLSNKYIIISSIPSDNFALVSKYFILLDSAYSFASTVSTMRKCFRSILLPTCTMIGFFLSYICISFNQKDTFSYVSLWVISKTTMIPVTRR